MKPNRPNSKQRPIINRITVNVPPNNQQKDSFDKWGNYIDRWSTLVNAILAIITVCVFILTIRSTNAAVSAADAAQLTYREQRARDSLDSIGGIDKEARAKLQFTIDTSNQRKQFELALAGLKAQINSLNQTEKNFEVQNKPYLEIIGLYSDTLFIGKPLRLNLSIVNLGNYPVKVLKTNSYTTTRITTPNYNDIYKQNNQPLQLVNNYIIKESPSFISIVEPVPVSNQRFFDMASGNYSLFFLGYIQYQNLVSKEIGVYKFLIKLNYGSNNRAVEYIINENH